jgi:hypothetical protein
MVNFVLCEFKLNKNIIVWFLDDVIEFGGKINLIMDINI